MPVDSRRSHFPLILLLAVAVTVLALASLDRAGACPWRALCGPLLADDISQTRMDIALPAPQADLWLEQRFVAGHNGLTEVELLLVRYGSESPTVQEQEEFSLELWDDAGRLVATRTSPTGELSHNQPYAMRFAPEAGSAGREYTLRLLGSAANQVSAWGYTADVLEPGELALAAGPLRTERPTTPARELRFVARYALTWRDAAAAMSRPLANEGGLLLATLLFLPLPGCLLLRLFRLSSWDSAARLGAALSLGIAVWPILWLWISLIGFRWTGPVLWTIIGVGWGVAARLTWRARRGRTPPALRGLWPASTDPQARLIHALLVVVLLVSVASRFVAVRDLAFPPWVDASRHALITAVMVANSRVITDYAPYLPVERFPYHFGFHTLAASLHLMTGRPLPELLIFLGQLLNGLLPLTVYSAGWLVTRRRAVGLLAAFFVALPFFFPGYYTTWGRLTQLTAMLVMPVLLALTWRLGRGWPRLWPLVGLLAAGVFLIHFRVFLFYLPFAALAAVAHLVGRRRLRALALAGLLAALLVFPRFVSLLGVTEPLQAVQRSLPGYNDFPIGYITTGWERLYLGMAGAATIVLLVGASLRRRWAAFPLLLVGWVGVLFVLLAGDRLGLPETLVVNLNSMYITLFLPLALFLAVIAGQLWRQADRRLRQRASGLRVLLNLAVGIALGVLLLFGWRQQISILNPETILALPQDAPALAWLGDNLPAEARVAVNAWQWLGTTWAGSDGGAWLTPLTGLASTTPPVDYIYNRDLAATVNAFNEAASAVDDWSDPAAARWLSEQGVTHVFVGRRGGFFDPAELSRNPAMTPLFRRDGTFVFAVGEE